MDMDVVGNKERLLKGILDGEATTDIEPVGNIERLLYGILKGETESNIEPVGHEEILLKAILEKGGGGAEVVPLSVTENGTYTAEEGTAYSPVTVNVAAVNKLAQVTDASLTEITAADLDGITIMRSRAFYQCTQLESVELPATLTKISDYAFNTCMSLKRVIIPEGIEQIGLSCFTATQLSEVVLPSSITSIGNSAFLSNYSLVSVIVRATTPPKLGTNAFQNSHSDLVIYVPAASVDAYKAATNWSTYASKIQAIPNS